MKLTSVQEKAVSHLSVTYSRPLSNAGLSNVDLLIHAETNVNSYLLNA